MHRVFRGFVLTAIAVFCFVSVGLASEGASPRLATFTCDITPPVGGHPLIWVTSVETVEMPLLAKGVVLDDGKHRYVLCALDWCGLCISSYDLFREKIANSVGIDATHVAVHCVHQHTAPYTDGDAQRLLDQAEKLPTYVDFKFLDDVTDRLADSVRKSLAKFKAFDHIYSHASRMRRRSQGLYGVPLVIRAPYGAGVRALEHHSDAPEALFAHIPGLKVVIPSTPADATPACR